MSQKWVLEKNNLILAIIAFDKEPLPAQEYDNVLGGGYWHYDQNQDSVYMYGESYRFGRVTWQQIAQVVKLSSCNFRVKGNTLKVFFSNSDSLGEAISKAVLIIDFHINWLKTD